MIQRGRKVSFWAKKPSRTRVSFDAKGKRVTFYAQKPRRAKVTFYARRKKDDD